MQARIARTTAYLTARRQWPVYALFLFALAVGYANHRFMRANDPLYDFLLPGGDNHNYHRWAGEIAQTFWLGWDRIPFTQGPLYPYFLAAVFLRFGIEYDAAALAQVLLGACNVALIFILARRVFGNPVAVIAGILAALSPNLLLYQNELLPETLVVTVNLLFLRALLVAGETLRWKHAAIAGFWLALCAIARPNALLVAPLLLIWLWWTAPARRIALRHSAIAVAAMVLAILPVTAANYFVGGQPALITRNASWNLYIGNAPDASGTYARPQSMWYIIGMTHLNEADINWTPIFWHFFEKDPAFLPRKLAKKTILFWQSGELPQIENYYLKREFSPFLRTPLTFGIIAPIGLTGIALALLRARKKRVPRSAALLVLYIAFFSVSIVITFVIARLRLPVLAVLFVFAGYAIVECARAFSHGPDSEKSFARAAAIALCALLLGLALHTWNPSMLMRWGDYYNLGTAYEARGNFDKANAAYDNALALNPKSPSTIAAKQGIAERLAAAHEAGHPR